jgi:putative ABC transport system ATP-binding protein
LDELGLADRADYRPSQLSVGQQQRVALARALANRPKLVLADEPTGNLDPELAAEALALLRGLCTEHGAALLVVSHDRDVLAGFETCVDLAAINLASTAGARA